MKYKSGLLFLILLAAVLLLARTLSSAPALSPAADAAGYPAVAEGSGIPVLVELFTSEGCSSCPPADRLLTRLEQTQPVPGVQIIGLSEHVDYWNRLGWRDPYSSSSFSERQTDYARVFRTEDIYTPQMVVDGRAEFVGNNADRARDAITAAARLPKAAIEVKAGQPRQGAIPLTISIALPPEAQAAGEQDVMLAVTESGLSSEVTRGENAGHRLEHSSVVRRLVSVGSLRSSKGGVFTAEPIVNPDKNWKRDRLRIIVFVQERASRHILGAAALAIDDRNGNRN